MDKLERCILNSRSLLSLHYVFKNLNGMAHIEEQEIRLIKNSIIKIKNIKNEKFFTSISSIFESYNRMINHKLRLKTLYSEQFDRTNENHNSLLLSIWERLKKNRDINMIDKRWCN
jgi:hypothetical protein